MEYQWRTLRKVDIQALVIVLLEEMRSKVEEVAVRALCSRRWPPVTRNRM